MKKPKNESKNKIFKGWRNAFWPTRHKPERHKREKRCGVRRPMLLRPMAGFGRITERILF
jgi:hypothetical protein